MFVFPFITVVDSVTPARRVDALGRVAALELSVEAGVGEAAHLIRAAGALGDLWHSYVIELFKYYINFCIFVVISPFI